MMPYSEEEIIQGFIRRDNEVLKYIYTEYLPSVIHLVKTQNGHAIDAEDLFQDALIIFFEKTRSKDFRLNCSFKTYLYSVSKFLWLHRLEKLSREVEYSDVMENTLTGYYDLEKLVFENEKDKLFHEHFLRLGENCRKVLSYVFRKMTTKEITRRLGYKSEIYVRKRKSQCRRYLIKSIMNDPEYKRIKNQMDHEKEPGPDLAVSGWRNGSGRRKHI
jgi:RNA polymerase sigma factor (sigma-70 family)